MGSKDKKDLAFFWLLVLTFECCCFERGCSSSVTYDHKALVIDDKRRVLQSGSIHYPRTTPEVWPDIIKKSKEGGLEVIETYVFWNNHEPVKGQEITGEDEPIGLLQNHSNIAKGNTGKYPRIEKSI